MPPEVPFMDSVSGLGPLEVFYSWQALLMSVIVYSATRSIKSSMYLLAKEDERRKLWVKHVALPVLPLLIGSLVAISIPMRPDLIEKYAQVSGSPLAIYAAFGACVGQFADYIHQRIESVLKLKAGSLGLGDDAKSS